MRTIKWLLMVVLVVFPSFTLAYKQINSAVLYALLFIALVVLIKNYRNSHASFVQLFWRYWPLNLAMASMMLAVFIHQVSTGDFQFRSYEYSFRLALFPVLFWLFLCISSEQLKTVQWGLVIGAVVSMIIMFVETNAGQFRPYKLANEYIITFANIALMLGFLAFLTIGWHEKPSKPDVILRIVALGAGIYSSYMSQARGNWLVLPVFIFIVGILFWKNNRRITFFLLVVFSVIILVAASFNNNVKDRFEMIGSDIDNYIHKTDLDTSLGGRFQLWHASWLIFKENPVIGIGRGSYEKELEKLASKNIITKATTSFGHSHNEILFQMVRYGIFGLFSLLLTIFVPALYFYKVANSSNGEIRTTAWMGLALCSGFFIYGLTDVLLVRKGAVTFYVIFIAILFAHIVKRKEQQNISVE